MKKIDINEGNKIIAESNKLIAEFMGYYVTDFNGMYHFACKEKKKPEHRNQAWEFRIEEAKYLTSWDWLMPVVEKICRLELGDDITYLKYACPRTFGMISEDDGQIMVRLNGHQIFSANTLIEATFQAVVDFITWHNTLPSD